MEKFAYESPALLTFGASAPGICNIDCSTDDICSSSADEFGEDIEIRVSGNPTKWAQKATIEAKFIGYSGEIVDRKYSIDGKKTWLDYTGALSFTQNVSVFFYAADNAGNQKTKSVDVTKVDSVVPTITVSGNPTAWTKNDVVLTVTSDDNLSGVKVQEYSFDQKKWTKVTGSTASGTLTVSGNTIVYFRAFDNAGNQSEIVKTEVKKIDKDLPAVTVKGNPEDWVSKAELTAVFTGTPSGIAEKKYTLDGKTWKTYTTDVVVTQNGTVSFRVTNYAGSTATTSVSVTKVDSVAPTISTS
ncbi:MAG: hypothetical protein MJ016_03970, partial [Victivallaceae bacterium]|nr:hypothetical protein [Victivallaceae bacterium]